jgi:hypothetical protein
MGGDKEMNEIVELLAARGVTLDMGLAPDELHQIEEKYSIVFPDDLRSLYRAALPISAGFPNWRDALKPIETSAFIDYLSAPFAGVENTIDDVRWPDEWGEEPADKGERDERILKELKQAPKLIPVFGHRYMPSTHESDFPVISVSGWDIIYYGSNLREYFQIEFGNLKWGDMDFNHIKEIPFWSNIM